MLDDKIVMQNDGQDYTTDQGFGSIVEWIGEVAKKQSPWAFTEIQGSGASGSNGGGVTKKFNEMNGAERQELWRSDRATFDRLSKQG